MTLVTKHVHSYLHRFKTPSQAPLGVLSGPRPNSSFMGLVRLLSHPIRTSALHRRGVRRRTEDDKQARAIADGSDMKGGDGKCGTPQEVLKQYGLAGVISYGVLNTLYYTCAFLSVWIYVAKVPRGLGTGLAVKKLLEVMAVVWAGSQLTKLARAGAAVVLAPVIDVVLNKLAKLFNVSKNIACFGMVVMCVCIFAVVFGSTAMIWA